MELIRRLYLTGLLAFFGSDEEPTTTTQTSLGLLGAFVYFVVISHFDPYVEQSDDTLAKVAAIQVVLTFFGATMLQARDNSADSEAGDPQGVYNNAIFAAVCVVVGLITLMAALYLIIAEGKEFRAAVSKSCLGKRMATPVNSAVKKVKKIASNIGSSESVTTADSEGVDEETSPPSPPSPDSPSPKAAL